MKSFVRTCLYRSGLLGAWHRHRNRRTLTTFMFHRVLPSGSEQLLHAEREFTLTTKAFDDVLDFVSKHYQVVRLQQVREALRGGGVLPSCPALLTFDDGWLDTVAYAAAALERHGMSATVFLSTEVLDCDQDRWWQDALVMAKSEVGALKRVCDAVGLAGDDRETGTLDRRLAAAFASLPPAERLRRLEVACPGVVSRVAGRQMLRESDLVQSSLDAGVLEFGAHGHTHAPLGESVNPGFELEVSAKRLVGLAQTLMAMSFPHGSCSVDLHRMASEVGFDLIFTSAPTLTDVQHIGEDICSLGRVHIPENEWTCVGGRISPPKLATYLFFRPIVAPGIAPQRAKEKVPA